MYTHCYLPMYQRVTLQRANKVGYEISFVDPKYKFPPARRAGVRTIWALNNTDVGPESYNIHLFFDQSLIYAYVCCLLLDHIHIAPPCTIIEINGQLPSLDFASGLVAGNCTFD